MVASELSNTRVAEIQETVGKPWTSKSFLSSTIPELHLADSITPVSPDDYLAKLKHETGSDEIVDQFLQKACKLDRELPPLSAYQWLMRLTGKDFRNVGSISKHHFGLTISKVGRFDLGTDGEDTFAVATNSEALWTQEAELPPLSPSADIESGDYHAHPALISLQKIESAPSRLGPGPSNTGTLTASGEQLPSLVMPIGQLQMKSKEETDEDYVDTEYVLVIDATKTNHPVWLIYDRNACGDLGERRLIHPDQEPVVFEKLGKNFDAMQVMPSLQWWLLYYGKLDFALMLKSMQATGITGPIKAKELSLSEAKKILG
ncbi:uncharacterized protein FFUJ_03802 [Fusarium fujikuroi IMI 58289]|uniref:Uncharacterized protein n=1 Tax=Gibberella fujikuroi (strain CBS 195.34 / IMI 58289 / NRRL A-6831) TaxID=1279085 RepID=S0DR55_GIBF5|nr:uncharacterized protein FFUJ_03802 [Fusarium fujikuroi IMI 58289]KLO85623.1 uncharacterized protein LW93_14238 [Fusarium fujikuroi]CCT64931.1 uncharacterized protein FFUJ_03802 [Fusarium fujikuroi IMI 58289]SCN71837.1 uncharacterized protein FFE2_02397 [Fusarium fujikuroi]SCN90122.1 uncharacterized protein FFM5_04881 [Fusarium fujikuroi]SCO36173.1 uncharacterized protein FFMR_03971 [Fusarium fujikuroi]